MAKCDSAVFVGRRATFRLPISADPSVIWGKYMALVKECEEDPEWKNAKLILHG